MRLIANAQSLTPSFGAAPRAPLSLARHHQRASDHIVVLADGAVQVESAPVDAITPDILAKVWQVKARVTPPDHGQIQVVVDAVLLGGPLTGRVRTFTSCDDQ